MISLYYVEVSLQKDLLFCSNFLYFNCSRGIIGVIHAIMLFNWLWRVCGLFSVCTLLLGCLHIFLLTVDVLKRVYYYCYLSQAQIVMSWNKWKSWHNNWKWCDDYFRADTDTDNWQVKEADNILSHCVCMCMCVCMCVSCSTYLSPVLSVSAVPL